MDQLDAGQLIETTSIASRAMKVIFHRGTACQRSRDKDAEKLVKSTLGDQGQIVTRRLFTNKQGVIYKRNQLANEMYNYHVEATLPYGDDGSRLLPNAMYLDYLQSMQGFEQKLAFLDAQITNMYPKLVQDDIDERNAALTAQGKPALASVNEYPSQASMEAHLYVQWVIEPISTAGDFRFQVDDHIKARLDQRLGDIAAQAKVDIYGRMLAPMKLFVEKLSIPIGEPGAVFRDSLTGNLNEMLAHLPKLNMDNDPMITQMLREIEGVVKPFVFNPDMLREVPEVRNSARAKMKELMKKLDGYGVR